jgi:hypothetical protein
VRAELSYAIEVRCGLSKLKTDTWINVWERIKKELVCQYPYYKAFRAIAYNIYADMQIEPIFLCAASECPPQAIL